MPRMLRFAIAKKLTAFMTTTRNTHNWDLKNISKVPPAQNHDDASKYRSPKFVANYAQDEMKSVLILLIILRP